ncbi:DUF1090 domain-containing protein [Pseudomonas sp. No.21]|jgi:hypothetical protein|uniref:DUF1090 domain-containing protein n=1 Tax=Pseudomonas TaxID=286 RepID=UPI000DA93DDD|nr:MULTISPECIES: DUF1090 domain-containing protein [Pseudomonas]MDW3710913.1 DUF1090 domain-containing protein [Pseudomonas sp. 2023EL-01195]PZE11703.1 DUF1090 domain-containing protein [Pseudomonas sp. 57B-090624]GJN47387.1 hypothetical protein TUM20249_33730 [Pseudomonas tohonis]
MRHSTAFLLTAGLALAGIAHAAEAPLTGCAAKRQALEARIEQARAHGNEAQVAGLQRALARVRTYCTDDGLRRDREAAVEKRRAEVREREAELREARAKGDAGKIAKREAKLAEARRELNAAEAQLQR